MRASWKGLPRERAGDSLARGRLRSFWIGRAVRPTQVRDDVGGLEHRGAGVGIVEPRDLLLAGAGDEIGTLDALLADVVQVIGDLELRERLAREAAVRRDLEAVELERFVR